MAKKDIKAKKGFTIIEVVLVLAIAGLIFLMVFVALPALQRSQRDTQRREDMARFMTQLENYKSNNSGKIPNLNQGAWDTFKNDYLLTDDDDFIDPDGTRYTFGGGCELSSSSTCSSTRFSSPVEPGAGMSWEQNKHKIYVYTKARCDGEKAVYAGDSPYLVAIRFKLEGGGIYCGNV